MGLVLSKNWAAALLQRLPHLFFCRDNYDFPAGHPPQPKPYPADSVAMRLAVLPLEDSLELRQAAHQLAEDFTRILPEGAVATSLYVLVLENWMSLKGQSGCQPGSAHRPSFRRRLWVFMRCGAWPACLGSPCAARRSGAFTFHGAACSMYNLPAQPLELAAWPCNQSRWLYLGDPSTIRQPRSVSSPPASAAFIDPHCAACRNHSVQE